jgi:hypothetical protein
MEFLRTVPVPVASFSIGPVSKRDVLRASVMLEHKVEYATILAFDVKINADAKLKVVRLFGCSVVRLLWTPAASCLQFVQLPQL